MSSDKLIFLLCSLYYKLILNNNISIFFLFYKKIVKYINILIVDTAFPFRIWDIKMVATFGCCRWCGVDIKERENNVMEIFNAKWVLITWKSFSLAGPNIQNYNSQPFDLCPWWIWFCKLTRRELKTSFLDSKNVLLQI